MPALFCVLGYALMWVALQPVWSLAAATAGMLIAEDAPNFNAQLSSIYDPENVAVPEPVVEDERTYISGRDVEIPDSGTQYARIYCEEIGLDAPVYWYDSDEILAYGVGQSLMSLPPGFGCAVILSGHNTTDFRCLENAAEGNVIHFDTNYGNYEYTVTHVDIIDENDLSHMLGEKAMTEQEELIMYTCYPFYAISGRKTQRMVVFADRTAGLDVKWRNLDG